MVTVASPLGGVVEAVVHLVAELSVVVTQEYSRQPRSEGQQE